MISYKETVERVETYPWPEQVKWKVTGDMMYFMILRSSLDDLSVLQITAFEDCVTRAMKFLRNINPAIELRVV